MQNLMIAETLSSSVELGPLQDDALTSRFRVWQRRRGHRYSLDDVLTAREALAAAPDAERALDLGCGLGSVALMVLHGLSQQATMVGIEAQAMSAELARRNVSRNGLSERMRVVEGDFRDEPIQERAGACGYELVTGTPPYAPVGTATPSPDSQRAHARIEYRGGVEAYIATGRKLMATDGVLVVCGDARRPERVYDAAAAHGLSVHRQLDAVPRAGRGPLFSVFTLRSECSETMRETFIARTQEGERTAAYLELRAFFGVNP